jgi:hypothetical protein
MSRGRTIAGALGLCAIYLCAFAANSAFAAEGLTAVECKNVGAGNGKFKTSACETPEAAGGEFNTVAFALNEERSIEGQGIGTSLFRGTVAGLQITVTCPKTSTSGKLTNVTPDPEKEMQVHGTAYEIHLAECEAHLTSKPPTEEACQIENLSGTSTGQKATITSNLLTWTTGAEHKITFSQPEGKPVFKFKIIKEGVTGQPCTIPTTVIEAKGTTIARANTEKHSHFTFEGGGTLTMNGVAAQFEATTFNYTTGSNGSELVGLTTVP